MRPTVPEPAIGNLVGQWSDCGLQASPHLRCSTQDCWLGPKVHPTWGLSAIWAGVVAQGGVQQKTRWDHRISAKAEPPMYLNSSCEAPPSLDSYKMVMVSTNSATGRRHYPRHGSGKGIQQDDEEVSMSSSSSDQYFAGPLPFVHRESGDPTGNGIEGDL